MCGRSGIITQFTSPKSGLFGELALFIQSKLFKGFQKALIAWKKAGSPKKSTSSMYMQIG